MPRRVLQAVSWLALAATLSPAIAYFRGTIELDGAKRWMLVATIVWFVVTPLWMERGQRESRG